MNEYIPGVCNIGKKEREFRRNAGILSLVLSVLYLIVIIVFKLDPLFKVLIFLPIFLSSISFLQYKMHFCAEFGILGKYNFADKIGSTVSVEQREYLKQDRVKALKIILYSFMISVAISALIVVLL